MTTPRRMKNHRATIGFLSGWQVYERTILADYYGEMAQGILRTAQERQSNVLLACGMSPSEFPIVVSPAFPIHDSTVDYVPIGEWNTDAPHVNLPVMYPLAMHREPPDVLRGSLRARRTLFEDFMMALAEKTGRRRGFDQLQDVTLPDLDVILKKCLLALSL